MGRGAVLGQTPARVERGVAMSSFCPFTVRLDERRWGVFGADDSYETYRHYADQADWPPMSADQWADVTTQAVNAWIAEHEKYRAAV